MTMSGAEFKREVGANPEKWAQRFLATYVIVGENGIRTEEDRLAFVTSWFRDAMEAAVKAAHDGRLQALLALPVVHREVEPLKPMENTMLREVLAGLRVALAAHERGDEQTVMECLKLKVKQLSIATDTPPSD